MNLAQENSRLSEPEKSENISVRRAVDNFKSSQIHTGNLLLNEYEIWGEVIDVRPGRDFYFLELRDKQEDGLVVDVWLPVQQSSPLLGDMIGVSGKFCLKRDASDGSVRFFFRGEKFQTVGPSQRTKARLQLIETLQNNRPTIRKLVGPVTRLTLITSANAKGGQDFRNVLGETGRAAIQVENLDTELDSPESIATQLVTAAARGVPVVVARGGGSNLDLDTFNHPIVIQAVHDCAVQVPVVLAIGHSSDRVLCARFAALDCHTPSEAARQIRSIHNKDFAARYRQQPQPTRSDYPQSPTEPAPSFAAHQNSFFRKIIYGAALLACIYLGWSMHALFGANDVSPKTLEEKHLQRGSLGGNHTKHDDLKKSKQGEH